MSGYVSQEMSTDYGDRYVFEAEWYDKVACILKKFYLYYYPSDNTVELVCTYVYVCMRVCMQINITYKVFLT